MTRFLKIMKVRVSIAGFALAMMVAHTAWAGNVNVSISQGNSVSQIKSSIQSAVNSAGSGDTVTVTGSKTNADVVLDFNIPTNRTVLWKAVYQSDVSFTDTALVALSGDGTFEVAGGTLKTEWGHVVSSNGTNAVVKVSSGTLTSTVTGSIDYFGISMANTNNNALNVIVSGTGKIEATADGWGISTFGSMEIKDSAVVSTTNGLILYGRDTNSNITIGGNAKVTSTSTSYVAVYTYGSVVVKDYAQVITTPYAIRVVGAKSKITVCDNGKVESNSVPVHAYLGNIEIKDNAQILSWVSDAVYAEDTNSMITIGGNSKIEAKGYSPVIFTYGNVEIKDNASVYADSAMVIRAYGVNSVVRVSGGTVSNAYLDAWTRPVICVDNSHVMNVFVSGTSKVEAKGEACTIFTSGGVEVKDQAQVISNNHTAIWTQTDSAKVFISGDAKVYNKSNTASEPVINMGYSFISNLLISGKGKVESASYGFAILTHGNVETIDSAQVMASSSMCIFAVGAYSQVLISGDARVYNTASNAAINMGYENTTNLVISSNGRVASAGFGNAVETYGKVETKDSAQVLSNGNAIFSYGENAPIIIGGKSKIEAENNAIETCSNVEIKDTAAIISHYGYGILTNMDYYSNNGDTAKVTINGGTIASGYCGIRVDGTYSTVTVNKGTLTAPTYYYALPTIYAAGSDATVTINGGTVLADVNSAISTDGDGSKVFVNGGTVSSSVQSSAAVINMENAYNNGLNVVVSGKGKVEATADGWGISTFGSVEIKDSAVVNVTDGLIIHGQDIYSDITIGGNAKVTSASLGYVGLYTYGKVTIKDFAQVSTIYVAIRAVGANSKITVCDNSKVEASSLAVHAFQGDIEIKNNAQVISYNNNAVYANETNATITVSGGTISTTTSNTIVASGDNAAITISGGTITSTTAETVKTIGDNAVVTVSGGNISATSENAIITDGIYATVLVSGGTLSNAAIGSYPVIFMRGSSTATNVVISGTAKVQATMKGSAIVSYGGKVEVKDQAQVLATVGNAISAGIISISGGLAFAYGNAIVDTAGVINILNPSNFTVTGTGVVIAWDSAAGNTQYDVNTTTDIIKLPSGATAVWNRIGSDNGIAYSYSGNTGFIVLNVSVGQKDPGATVAAPVKDAATHNSITIYAVTPPSNGQTVEYGINTTPAEPNTWQNGLTFSGLNANTTYYVYARAKENNSYTAGAALYTAMATERQPVFNSGGAATITFTETAIDLSSLSGLFTIDINAGLPTYSVQTDASSTGAGTISGNNLTVSKSGIFKIGLVTAINNDYAAGALTIATLTVNKAPGGTVSAPTLNSKAGMTIFINAVTPPSSGQDVEYGINTVNSAPSAWQAGLTFAGLTLNTDYYIFARVAENDNYFVGAASSSLQVTTDSTLLPPSITTKSLPNGEVGTPYSETLTAIGDYPITWGLKSGNLPDGLTLDPDGEIAGEPTVAGTFTFTVKATNSVSEDTKELSIVITKAEGVVELGITNYELRVFPNPAKNQLRITNYEIRNNDVIGIYDIMGRTINNYQLSIVNSQLIIDISHLANGIYYLKIDNKTVRFVKE